MNLLVIGLNHKTAPVAMREQLAFGDDLPLALAQLKAMTDGAVIVSTCNRSEIYAYLPDREPLDDEWQDGLFNTKSHSDFDSATFDNATFDNVTKVGDTDDNELSANARRLVDWLAKFKNQAFASLLPYLYIYQGNRALNHWLRVAVGLDSMILGEPQILGQIRSAVAISHAQNAIGTNFDWLTQRLFGAARIVRRDTALGEQAVSLGFATAKLVTQIFDNPTKTTLLIVAAGEMNRLVAHNVSALGMQKIIIANRSAERANALADELSQMAKMAGRTVEIVLKPLAELDECLCQADIVSACSGSMETLISVPMVKNAMKVRKGQAMLLVDLAVPRDIDSEVGRLDNVFLYSIDDLQYVIAGNIESRKQAALDAEVLVSQLTADIESQWQIANMGKIIGEYQAQLQQKTQKLLTQAKKELTDDNAEQVLEKLAYQLQNTLAHPTLSLLRQSAITLSDDDCEWLGQTLLGAYREYKK